MTKNEEWHRGALFIYQASVINGAGGGGNVSVQLVAGAGSEFELHYGTISHNDATASDVDVVIRDADDDLLVNLYDIDAVTQNSLCQFPSAGGAPATTGNASPEMRPIFLAGDMELFATALAIDLSEGITVSLVGRVYGLIPTITETGNATPAITINEERII